MKLITRDTDYALRALSFMAKKGKGIVAVSELAEKLNMPRPFLRKILQALNKEGVLKSYKGPGGGFALAKPAKSIFLVDLMRQFQGPLRLNECLFKKITCPDRKTCALRKKISNIEKHMISQLKSITIASLLK